MKKLIIALIIGISAVQLIGGEKQQASMNSVSAAGKDDAVTPKATVPAALVGTWRSGSLAATNFYNPSTQQWSKPSGRGIFLIVQANGEYRFGAGEQITSTDYFLYQEGRVAINGAKIVLSPKMGSEYARDASTHKEGQRASTKGELQASTLKFRIVTDQNGTKLLLTNENGEQVILRPSAQ